MDVKKCDRCGDIYKQTPFDKKDVWLAKNEKAVDLCSRCRKELAEWYYGPMIPDVMANAASVAHATVGLRNNQFRMDQLPPREREKIMTELCEGELELFCANCRSEVRLKDKYCTTCGFKI